MNLDDFLNEIDDSVKSILDSSFTIEVYDTDTVPHFNDSSLTFDNLDESVKKCKRLESCVLYVDIRNSAAISSDTHPRKLARLYSAFIRSMIKSATHCGGHVRNVIGDRVMVVFDKERCFSKAVETAIVMNSVAQYIIDRHYPDEFKCGIGIDYGKMLVTKAGEVRRGANTEFYRSLVWLGKPANIASRLTDIANKSFTTNRGIVVEGLYYPNIKEWSWIDRSFEQFINNLEVTHSRNLQHKNEHFNAFITSSSSTTVSYPPILITEAVFNGFKKESPEADSILKGFWKTQSVSIKEYSGLVYGGDIHKIAVEKLSK